MTHEAKIALLIDADNCPATKIDEILDELARFGVINIRRAYGNWKSPNLRSWEVVLHDYAIQPVQQFAYTKGKNATDSAMIIDAMDLLYSQRLDGFGLASSDSDFTPLVMRIRANGLKVFGFGEEKTPKPFVSACSRFLYLETLGAASSLVASGGAESQQAIAQDVKAAAEPTPSASQPIKAVQVAVGSGNQAAAVPEAPTRLSPAELKSDTRLVNLLRKSVEAAADEEGWAHLGAVGQHISKRESFDARNLGYAKLSDLFQAIGLFEVRKHNNGLVVRDKRAGRQGS
jgi:uncharacterized LabA/DUF88 family protein